MTKAPKLTAFRNCFEASMTFDEAIGCSDLSEKPPEVIEILRATWDRWESSFWADCRSESALA